MSWNKLKDIAGRMLAVFIATALGVIGTGAVIGVEVWQAALMAGIGGVATVLEGLSRAYLQDGKLTVDEINGVFGKAHEDLPAKKK
jgi:hypothetical protein